MSEPVTDRKLKHAGLSERLPDYGVLYFDHLNAELKSRNYETVSAELHKTLESIQKKRENQFLTWNDLYSFDLILARDLSIEKLSRKVWSLRSRYRDVAGLREYEAYLASKPPDLASQTEEKQLRADIEYLLSEIYLRYAIRPVYERERNMIFSRVSLVVFIGLILIIVPGILVAGGVAQSKPITLLLVLIVGAMGGLLSMQQRYQQIAREGDIIENINGLKQGWPLIFLPASNGAIFAFLLYLLIMGKLIEGTLFPEFSTSQEHSIRITGSTPGVGFMDLIAEGRPTDAIQYAKLIVWSFLAGFAERLVPDALTRFVIKRGLSNKESQ